jgi:hypothetical protein
MCFALDENHHNVLIANKDIVCYKFLDVDGDRIVSPYRKFIYNFNETYSTYHSLKVINDNVHEGYHSYTKLKIVVRQACNRNIIVRCIIPKGSEYYINDYDEEYVSNNIIIKEIVNPDEIICLY